ncbi:DMT family transporter [Arcobacter sp. CECT 8985]|uniref:DMT family transporter n=1 Tax=Arcobacter sp. CECT 8985 TaxID=1935424 RepID=UPI00100C1284|nr:DMT family transporter [Arcobacter sp. CECT 8985]RXJ83602.1 permease [Arcobacter sp. CECT 8985]
MKKLINENIAIVYIALCIILWSLIPTFVKITHSELDHHLYLFYSSIISFLSIFIVAVYEKSLNQILYYSKRVILILLFLGFLDFLYYLLLYFGYKKANGLEVLVIQYMWPIFIVFFSLFILKEAFTTRKFFSIIFGFFGVVLVITKGDFSTLDFSQIDVLFIVMIGTISFALFSVLSKKVKVNATNAVMLYFFSAIIYSAISVGSYSSFSIPSSYVDWFSILINGIFLNGISYLFWIKGLKAFDASKVAPFIFITPILAAFFLILFFDEPVLPIYFLGLFFVILSGLINSFKFKKIAYKK